LSVAIWLCGSTDRCSQENINLHFLIDRLDRHKTQATVDQPNFIATSNIDLVVDHFMRLLFTDAAILSADICEASYQPEQWQRLNSLMQAVQRFINKHTAEAPSLAMKMRKGLPEQQLAVLQKLAAEAGELESLIVSAIPPLPHRVSSDVEIVQAFLIKVEQHAS
jgi:hypothetical protein